MYRPGYVVVHLVQTLRYKAEGRGLDGIFH
jgi:hypothetical protein